MSPGAIYFSLLFDTDLLRRVLNNGRVVCILISASLVSLDAN
jgi:hypothetical protein